MIQLLSERQNPANDFKLQHAILQALRNFAVTQKARPILLEKGSQTTFDCSYVTLLHISLYLTSLFLLPQLTHILGQVLYHNGL